MKSTFLFTLLLLSAPHGPSTCPAACDQKAAACVDACEVAHASDPAKRVACKVDCADKRAACEKACPP